MSIKRQAPTELNHENWDREDSAEREEMGTFKTAPKEVLEKRVIRTAKRRSQVSSDETKKSVFSGFGGFNKIPQSSFDFLANLTNGSKSNSTANTNTAQPPTTDTAVSSSIFANKSPSSTSSSGIFSISGSSGFGTNSSLGKPSEGSLFGASATNNSSPIQSIYTAKKPDSNESPFKLTHSPATDNVSKPIVSTPQLSSSMVFGAQPNSGPNKSLLSSTASNPTLFSTQAVSSTSSSSSVNSATVAKADSNTAESDKKERDKKKYIYYSKLKDLNESVCDWIKKHVGETPLCILSPIFVDYEKYLKEIEEEYNGGEPCVKSDEKSAQPKAPPETKIATPASNNVNTSVFGNSTPSNFGKSETPQSSKSVSPNSSSFNFGITSTTITTTMNTNPGFSFGINSSTQSTATSLFSVNTSSTTNSPFSFGINKSGFGFNVTSPTKTETSEAATENEDEPPKVEFTPVVEENSVFDTKCKIFIKKDGNFVDKGVGTLYIKKIEESGKHQLLVRANTNLGSILLNLILSASIPTQRMGKNNVMLVCIPTPDAKPPPTPILIRVKTAEDADELLSTLNKYKA